MHNHEVISPFSTEWWSYNLITILFIVITILIGKSLTINQRKIFSLSIGYFFIFEFLFMEIYRMYSGSWSIHESLPLHLCSLMWFVAIYLFLTKKQWAFEIMLFIGLPAGIHSLLTPELTHGISAVNIFDFFLGHGGLVLAPFYAMFVLKMTPRQSAWIRCFLRLQTIIIIVFLLNFIIPSNYMYLSNPPIANNPLIPSDNLLIGQWPFYILIFEIALFAHAFVINLPFIILRRFKKY